MDGHSSLFGSFRDDRTDPKQVEYTARLISRARRLLAYGGLDGVVSRPLLDGAGGTFPQFAVSASGCRFTDSTGRSFIDWVNGWGPVLLGYRNPKVEEAIRNQMAGGPVLSLMHPVEIELADQISQMVPCAEMVAFGKNGSDSVTASIRIARAVTGREVILQSGFHGFHDWYTCLHPEVKGVPARLKELVDPFNYNDIEHLDSLFTKHSGKVAAVIMEPVNMWMPKPGYLESVRELTHRHGALLIFDEMVTAFRVAIGGAQELFGVIPDLTCLGKAMGNGMPLFAVVGRRNYMQYLPACGFGMTFRGETLSMAAALKTLQIVREENVPEHLARMGNAFRQGFAKICSEFPVRCDLLGPPSRMTFVFHDQNRVGWQEIRSMFLQESLRHGVLTNGNMMASYAHDEAAVDETLQAVRKAMETVSQALGGASKPQLHPVGGAMFGLRRQIATGFVDHVHEEPDALIVGGWMMLEDGPPDSIVIQGEKSTVPAEKINRPDLKTAFANQPRAEWAGFRARLPAADFAADNQYRFRISAQTGQSESFNCIVVYTLGNGGSSPWTISDGVLYV